MERNILPLLFVRGIGKPHLQRVPFYIVPGLAERDCDRYDFDLATGESETGLRACVYEVSVREPEPGGEAEVWVEAPQGATGWQLVNLRPVSEGTFVSQGSCGTG